MAEDVAKKSCLHGFYLWWVALCGHAIQLRVYPQTMTYGFDEVLKNLFASSRVFLRIMTLNEELVAPPILVLGMGLLAGAYAGNGPSVYVFLARNLEKRKVAVPVGAPALVVMNGPDANDSRDY